jgi:hypothetical protein
VARLVFSVGCRQRREGRSCSAPQLCQRLR